MQAKRGLPIAPIKIQSDGVQRSASVEGGLVSQVTAKKALPTINSPRREGPTQTNPLSSQGKFLSLLSLRLFC